MIVLTPESIQSLGGHCSAESIFDLLLRRFEAVGAEDFNRYAPQQPITVHDEDLRLELPKNLKKLYCVAVQAADKCFEAIASSEELEHILIEYALAEEARRMFVAGISEKYPELIGCGCCLRAGWSVVRPSVFQSWETILKSSIVVH